MKKPNKETIKAMEELKAGNGLKFKNADELFDTVSTIKYRDLIIEDIILGSAPLDQTEITIVTDEIVIKNIYLPYSPIHNKLSSRKTPLKDKMEVFGETVLENLDSFLEIEKHKEKTTAKTWLEMDLEMQSGAIWTDEKSGIPKKKK
ncbi:hypothetical protein [Epilithonimonas tenax]|uniref:hypothetical protein n=1 Tax=Epilithonimonas tenax TaxID=191577 RepID=UPI000483EE54|nr:hypothetical protein [Epilithonimonas tenax]